MVYRRNRAGKLNFTRYNLKIFHDAEIKACLYCGYKVKALTFIANGNCCLMMAIFMVGYGEYNPGLASCGWLSAKVTGYYSVIGILSSASSRLIIAAFIG
jgi:hypothetical protein